MRLNVGPTQTHRVRLWHGDSRRGTVVTPRAEQPL